ncbi:MAG: hypothetical protein LBL33_05575 [Tannerella sp.]|nr:hypothetical protein [Tannerella sp.]
MMWLLGLLPAMPSLVDRMVKHSDEMGNSPHGVVRRPPDSYRETSDGNRKIRDASHKTMPRKV